MISVVRCTAIIITAILLATELYGQSKANLTLTVVDQQSGEITGGKIRLLSTNGSVIAEKEIKENHQIIFNGLVIGKISVEIESPGFEIFREEITLNNGANSITAKLNIREIKAEMEVTQSTLDRRLEQAFSSMLSQREIDSLPDDPREIEKELKRRYGDDVVIRINGFTGGVIPPKDAIRSIQVIRSGFDAEYHELGRPSLNIITKASTRKFVGLIMLNYGNSAINARHPFAPTKLPEQTNSIIAYASGPLINKKSAFNLSWNQLTKSEKQNIIAVLPGVLSAENESVISRNYSFSGGIDYNITSKNTLRLDYQNTIFQIVNAGVGGLNTVERGFTANRESHEIKVSVNGTLGERLGNQFRARFSFKRNAATSNSQSVGITISDAFNAGGAGLNNSSSINQIELFEMISFGHGIHFTKFGAEFRYEHVSALSANGINGNYFFSNVENYLARLPSTYYVTKGATDTKFNRFELAIFAQDDFQVVKRLNIGFGLRYEIQNHLAGANNFSPRLSATFAADSKGRFILRSGAGILYQWYETGNIQRILENDGKQIQQFIVVNPTFSLQKNPDLFQNSLSPSIYKQAVNLQSPRVFIAQTALNINLKDGVRFDAAYKLERGNHQFRSRDINAPLNGVRLNGEYGQIRYLESSGIFTRNSLEISGEGVLFKRARVSGRYRLSKTTDDYAGIFDLPMDSYNLRLERGTSNLDQRHYFTGSLDYSPFKDFSVNPSFIIASPQPYTITTGFDNNGDTVFNDRPQGVARNTARGDWVRNVNVGISWSIPFLKRAVTVKRDGKQESVENLPDTLKHHKITLSVNVNNIFNTTNKSNYIGNRLSPFFGQATVAAPARNITFGLMFVYF